jgi:hypothetical protein
MKSFFDQTSIKLGILVVGEGFIVPTNRVERMRCHKRMMPMVNPAALSSVSMRRSTVTKDGILCRCSCALKTGAAFREHAYDDRVGIRSCLHFQQLLAIVRGIFSMRVYSNQEFCVIAAPSNSIIYPSGLDALWVIDCDDPIAKLRKPI